jgi:hypothetical protein
VTDKIEGFLEVGTNGQGEVVINHPDLQPDENGVGHIVFSPEQARNLAALLLRKATDAENEVRRVRMAYTAICSKDGFTIGLAEENQRGYWPAPLYGTFPTWEAASIKASELNRARGLSDQEAIDIVLGSMREQNRQEQQ